MKAITTKVISFKRELSSIVAPGILGLTIILNAQNIANALTWHL